MPCTCLSGWTMMETVQHWLRRNLVMARELRTLLLSSLAQVRQQHLISETQVKLSMVQPHLKVTDKLMMKMSLIVELV